MKTERTTGPKLTRGQKAAYGLPAFALALVGIPVYVHIPKFYTDTIGVDIALVGAILLAVRLFDAVTDPLLGVISDGTRSRMGRRRPYMLWGCIGLAAAVMALFAPPHMTAQYAVVWFAISVFALFIFWTLVAVPYESLGPEITSDYDERTTLFAVRDGLLIAGTLMAAAAPAAVRAVLTALDANAGERAIFFWIAILYIPMLVGFCGWCVWRVRERPHRNDSASPPTQRIRNLKSIVRNRPFIILLIAFTISALGSNLPATLILYYVEYVLESTRAELFLVLYFAAGIVFLPAWIKLSERFGKKETWLASMVLNTIAFSGVFFLGSGDELLYGILVVLSGVGFGATLALPSAIQADVIDYDEYLTGQRQEGWYIGIWSVVKKLTAAVGVGVGLTVLGAVGYTPGSAQPPEVITALKVLYALVPSVCNGVAIVIALRFPISREAHKRIMGSIADGRMGRPVNDPLRS